MKFPAFSNIRV